MPAAVAPSVASAKSRGPLFAVAAVLILAAIAGGYFYSHRTAKLSAQGSIVLADFTNTTGDPVFDGALRQGLASQLAQSPLLHILSDRQMQQTLQYMGQPATARVTNELARQICQRTQSAAALEGSIAQIGNTYSLIINAANCASGETLATVSTEAPDKDHVLDALGQAAENIRGKLGESLASIQKYNTPIDRGQHLVAGGTEKLQSGPGGARQQRRSAIGSIFQAGHRARSEFRDGLCQSGAGGSEYGRTASGRRLHQKSLRFARPRQRSRTLLHRLALLRECKRRPGQNDSGIPAAGSKRIRATRYRETTWAWPTSNWVSGRKP